VERTGPPRGDALRATEPLLNIRLFVNRGFSGGVASVFLNAFLLFSAGNASLEWTGPEESR